MPTTQQVIPQHLQFGRCVGTDGAKVGDDCAILGDLWQCRRLDCAIPVPDRLYGQLEPVEPVRRGFQYVRTARPIPAQRLYVTVMHMARCVMLAMPGDEAYRLGALLQDAFDAIGHLAQIHGVLYLCATALRLYNDRVVQLHAVIARCSEFSVEVEHPYPKMRLLPSYYRK